jgi:hypothetical protein
MPLIPVSGKAASGVEADGCAIQRAGVVDVDIDICASRATGWGDGSEHSDNAMLGFLRAARLPISPDPATGW